MKNIIYGKNRKNIKQQLFDKVSEWTDSIDDPDLVKAIKKDTIITGGSIASMLIGESVNDYDVYFKTKETTRRVAAYYAYKMGVNSNDEILVKQETITNIKGVNEERIVVFVTSEGIAIDDCEKDKSPYRPVFLSQNAITLSDSFQIIIRFYGCPKEIHDNYDFEHAKNYYDFFTNELILHPEALECLLSRTLIYRGSLYPIASIFRVKKFIERGWRISAGQLLKIMWQISEIDLTDKEVLREQLTGVDQAYLDLLIDELEDVDSSKLTSDYVCEVIDRIFE